jgi:hypothetical protein
VHSKKIGTVFSIGLTHCFFVRLISWMVLIGAEATWVKLFFDKTDVAAAFYTSEPNLRQVVNVAVETHVLLKIVN